MKKEYSKELLSMTEGNNVVTITKGATHKIPKYEVSNNGLIKTKEWQEIKFVKGNIEGKEFRQIGIITEDLLELALQQLSQLNQGHFENSDTAEAINFIKQAKQKLIDRKNNRAKRGVLGTYKK
jgi:hypothetical protein